MSIAGNADFYEVSIVGGEPSCPHCGEVVEGAALTAGNREKYDRVTTVIGATMAKHGLTRWAANIAVEGMLTLTQEKGWDLSSMDVEEAKSLLDAFGFTADKVRDSKADVGTGVHEVLEEAMHRLTFALEGNDYEGALVYALSNMRQKVLDLPDEEQGYALGVLQWIEDRRPLPIWTEQTIACHHRKVAGTVDLYWEVTQDQTYQRLTPKRKQVSWEVQYTRGQRVVLDLKTSKDFRDSHFVQVAWYGGHMVREDLGLPVDKSVVLKVSPEGGYEEKEALCGPEVFEALERVYRLLKGKKIG